MTVLELISLLAQCDPYARVCYEIDGMECEITAVDLTEASRKRVYVTDRTADDTPDLDAFLFPPPPRPEVEKWANIMVEHPMPLDRAPPVMVRMEQALIDGRILHAIRAQSSIRVTYTTPRGTDATQGRPIALNEFCLLMPGIQIPRQTIVQVQALG